jgi:hypothetical protein
MPTTTRTCTLDEALAYENDEVVHRFTKLYDIGFDEANDVFVETKRWLWLIRQSESSSLAITDPLVIIDEMWHNFVLFTPDYTRHCFDLYGCYIHHAPTTEREKSRWDRRLKRNPSRVREEQLRKLSQQFKLIGTKLGPETLLKWFVEYPARYDEEFFNHRRQTISLSYTPPTSLQALSAHVQAGRIVIVSPEHSTSD